MLPPGGEDGEARRRGASPATRANRSRPSPLGEGAGRLSPMGGEDGTGKYQNASLYGQPASTHR